MLTIAERLELRDLIDKYTNNPEVLCSCECADNHAEDVQYNDDCPHFNDAITLAKALRELTKGL